MNDKAILSTMRFLGLFAAFWLFVMLIAWQAGNALNFNPFPSDMTRFGLMVQGTIFLSAIFAAVLTYLRTYEMRRRNDLQRHAQELDELTHAISLLAEESLVSQTASLVQLARIWDTSPTNRKVIAQALSGFAKDNARKEQQSGPIVEMVVTFSERLKEWQNNYHIGHVAIRSFRNYSGFEKFQAGVLTLDNSEFHEAKFVDCVAIEVELVGRVAFKKINFDNIIWGTINDNTEDFVLEFDACSGAIHLDGMWLDVTKHHKIEGFSDLYARLEETRP
jgi:hypothetical protein